MEQKTSGMMKDLTIAEKGAPSKASTVECISDNNGDVKNDKGVTNYTAQKMIGHGSFGAVFMAKNSETDEIVAIKKVLQDKRFKNRELQIMRQLATKPHPYIIALHNHFTSKGTKADDVYLNLVLEYIPETVYSIGKQYSKMRESVPLLSVKIYIFQLSRALAHIHGLGICHRDIKPQNLLVDPTRHVLKLCDFGSAKCLVPGEPNVAYICSRYYRAPELIIGASEYTPMIDVWSEGCVLAELLLGNPIFVGGSGVDQIIEVIKVMGTPSKEEMLAMNPFHEDISMPQMKSTPWSSVFKSNVSPDAISLVSKLLVYDPKKRVGAIDACTHPFFNEIKNPATKLPNGNNIPQEMFIFTPEELSLGTPETKDNLSSLCSGK